MADKTSTPRVNCPLLDSYVGRNVMMIGKVVQLRGEVAILDVDGNVTANLNRDAHLTHNSCAQIIGKVNPDLSVKVLTSMDLGDGVDMGVSRSVVETMQSLKQIFEFPGGGGGMHH